MDRYNTFWRRLSAAIIDGIILLPLSFIDTYSEASANKLLFCIGLFISSAIYTVYFVILHARFGQTLGKKFMKVKVFDIDEINLLGIKRALIRESPWIILTIGIFLYLVITIFFIGNISLQKSKEEYDSLTFIISFTWMLIQLITMFSNYKRRAMHDYLAKSVVVKISN